VRVIISGGGTGGHIYPALSLVKAINEHYPKAEFLYLGTPNGLEATIVPSHKIPFKTLKVSGIKRSLSLENCKTVLQFLTSVGKAKTYIKEFNPDIVIGTGGYVCGPVVYAATKMGIKTLIHEQNSLPGITNKFLGRYVDSVCICFEEAKKFFNQDKVVLTGNPRASEVAKTLKLGKSSVGLNPKKKTVLISGGSRGARPINDAIISMIKGYDSATYEVIFVTGSVHYEAIRSQIENVDYLKNVKIVPFIEDMPKFLINIDLFVGRSGATTLAELTSLGIPSILIPSPYVAENHQEFNARSITDHSGGILILEKDLTSDKLFNEITKIMNDELSLSKMKIAAKKLGIPDANQRLLDEIKQLLDL